MQGTFDRRLSELNRIEAEERVLANATHEWRDDAIEACLYTAQTMNEFIVDDVWKNMPSGSWTLEARAMGPIVKQAVKNKWIEPTDSYKPSARASSHSNPRRVWKSLVFKPMCIDMNV